MPLKFHLDTFEARTRIFGTFLSLVTMGEWVLTAYRPRAEDWASRLERFAEKKNNKEAHELATTWRTQRQLRLGKEIGNVMLEAWDFIEETLQRLEQVQHVPSIDSATRTRMVTCLRQQMGFPKTSCSPAEKRSAFAKIQSRVLSEVEKELKAIIHPSLSVPAFAMPIVKAAIVPVKRDRQDHGESNFGLFAMVREFRGFVVPFDSEELRNLVVRDVLWLTGYLPDGCDDSEIVAKRGKEDCGFYFSAAENAVYRLTHARELQNSEYQFFGHQVESEGGDRANPIRIFFPIAKGLSARVRHALLGASTYDLNRPGAWKALMISARGYFDTDLELALSTLEKEPSKMLELLRNAGMLGNLYSHNDLQRIENDDATSHVRIQARLADNSTFQTDFGISRRDVERQQLLERRKTFRQMTAPGISPAFSGILNLKMEVTKTDFEGVRNTIRDFLEAKVMDNSGGPLMTTDGQIDVAADELTELLEKTVIESWYAVAPVQLILWVPVERQLEQIRNNKVTEKLIELAAIMMEPVFSQEHPQFQENY